MEMLKFLEFKTSVIASAGFSVTTQQKIVQALVGLLDLFC